MPDSKVIGPVVGAARKAAIDNAVDEMQTGRETKPKHPAASKPVTPERNSTYDDMEARIYGSKSAKAKR